MKEPIKAKEKLRYRLIVLRIPRCKNFINLHFRSLVVLRNDPSGGSPLVIRRGGVSLLIFRCCGPFINIHYLSIVYRLRSLLSVLWHYFTQIDSCPWTLDIQFVRLCWWSFDLAFRISIYFVQVTVHYRMIIYFHGENMEIESHSFYLLTL